MKGSLKPTVVAVAIASAAHVLTATPAPKQLVWRFDAAKHFEGQGLTIHDAGDVNGDGVSDVITGLKTMPAASSGNHISARVYSGVSGALLLEIPAPQHEHSSSNPVAGLGDLTGDSRSEFIVGTPDAEVVRIFSGTGAVLKTITQPAGSAFGASVAAAGDANGDGVMDIIAGAPGLDAAFVYSGAPPNAAGFPLLATFGGDLRTRFGASVGTAGVLGSVKGSAVVIGAPLFGGMNIPDNNGRVYVFRITNTTQPLFMITGTGTHDLLGTDVDGGRDIDGDGTPDFMASAIAADVPPPQGSGQTGNGYVLIFSGKDASVLRKFASNQVGDLYGFSAELGGPCNGQPTLVVGAPQAADASNGNAIAGRALVYDARTGALHTEIYGEAALNGMGISVGRFIDLTGDGHAEFLAGAHGTQIQPPGLFAAGSAFVYSCRELARPDITATPSPLSFGGVGVATAKNGVVQITNQGTAPLHISSLALAPGSNPSFSLTAPAAPITLAPAASQAIAVGYTPATPLVHGATLRATSDDPDTPVYDIPISGKGLSIKIEVTPPAVDFGNVDVDDSAGALIQVKNAGNQPLSVSNITLPGGEFSLSAVPPLPKTLAPGQSFPFLATFKPGGGGMKTATASVASTDPVAPSVGVALSGNGVPPNLPPTAVINMQVPYVSSNTGVSISYRGDKSFDAAPSPPNSVVGYLWDFAGALSPMMNATRFVPCAAPAPCLFVMRLAVTDNGGKSDPTSVTTISWTRALRSRFYGTIKRGGSNVADGTIVEAWIATQKVAQSLTQTNFGRSVYAIEVPPDPGNTGAGGKDGNTVSFRYGATTATQTGTWYSATDQELDLTAPNLVLTHVDWCTIAQALGVEVCGSPSPKLPPGIHIALEEWPVDPNPDPGPLKQIGAAFTVRIADAATGANLERLPPYQIRVSYADRQVAAAGADERTLGLFVLTKNRWIPAGRAVRDLRANQVVATVTDTGVFSLRGMAR